MYKFELEQGKDTTLASTSGKKKRIPFNKEARQHNFILDGILRNPDGSKRKRKSAVSNMPITVITEN